MFTDEFAFRCFPAQSFVLGDDEVCRSMYSAELHESAIDGRITTSYGAGGAAAIGAGGSVEVGTVYGADGCFGCYTTTCIGGETNAEINIFASVGLYDSYEEFQGEAIVEIGSAGIEIVSLVFGLVISRSTNNIVGAYECLSLGLSVIPISFGVYSCDTTVDTVGCLNDAGDLVAVTNNPPVARCQDVVTCIADDTGLVDAEVDNGSFDPDGDAISSSVAPAGPYLVGEHFVTLTVTDSEDEFDSCDAMITVDGPCVAPGTCGAGVGCTPGAPALAVSMLSLCCFRSFHRRRRPQ